MLLAFVFAAALAAAPDAPATSAPTAPEAQKSKPAQPELTCRMETLVGSRFKKKVCMTADEWKLEELYRERNDRLRRGTIEVGSGL